MLSFFKLFTICTLAVAFLSTALAANDIGAMKRIEIAFERRNVTDVFKRPGSAVGKTDAASAVAPPVAESEDQEEEWANDSYDDDEEDFTIISQPGALEKRGKARYAGQGTYFYPGLGNCGDWNGNNDLMVAIPSSMYKGGRHCGKWMKICHKSKCVSAQVKDSCPTCGWGSLDMSPRVFKALAPLSKGSIGITWKYL
ncbi:hypothetical protein ACQY0O_000889 [Thecaphora frezii]